jgi:RNA polymerase sigma factor (sigma-70 family)
MESAPGRSDLVAHHAASWGWALSCTAGDRDEAESVLQTSYLRILDGSARFDGRSGFRTFLFGVIRNVAASRRRRRLLEKVLFVRLLSSPPRRGAPDDRRADDEAFAVRQALSRLAGRQREVLHLVFYEDLTIEEASRVLGIGVGSARTHYERGKRHLRTMLRSQEAGREG